MEKEIRQEGDYTITEGIHGDTYHHPSFGMLSFSRVHGGHSNLFGSSIQHRNTIHMVLKEGTVSRELNEDWYFGGPEIVEVEMSQSQFAELTPDGCIRDADTILVDLIEENDFEFFGFAHDIFNIWKNSSDKEAVEHMFYEFTDMSFKEYLEKCKREISR